MLSNTTSECIQKKRNKCTSDAIGWFPSCDSFFLPPVSPPLASVFVSLDLASCPRPSWRGVETKKGRRRQNRGRCVSYTSSQMSESARTCRRPCLCYFWGVERLGLGPFTPPLSPYFSLSFSRCTTSVGDDDTIYHFHVLSNTPLLVVAPLRRPPLLCYPKERSGRAALPLVGKRRGRSRYCFKTSRPNLSAAAPSLPIPKTHQQLGCVPPLFTPRLPLPLINDCTVFCHHLAAPAF